MAKLTTRLATFMALCANPAFARAVLPRQNNGTTFIRAISDYVDSRHNELLNISQTLHDNPELGFKEVKAHELLTSFMEAQGGWTVTRSLYNISTAFSAVFEGNGDGPIVSFNSEYGQLKARVDIKLIFN